MHYVVRTLIVTGALFAASASHAQAATTLGQTFAPAFPACSANNTLVQGVDPSAGASYHAPSAGVITSWSYQADASANEQLKFKVAQPLTATTYNVVAQSALETILPSVLNTFPTRLPIEAGDTIGYFNPDGAACLGNADPGAIIHLSGGDKQPGDPWTFPASQSQFKLNVSAQIEPDVDDDGFGDETQDQCPADPATQASCSYVETDTDPPNGSITKGPKKKTEKHKVKFKFASDEPNSTFECRLKGPGLKPAVKQFRACTSPRTYKGLEEGKYTFSLEATDNFGNFDPTLAVRKFKIIGEA